MSEEQGQELYGKILEGEWVVAQPVPEGRNNKDYAKKGT